ncbi:transcription elongation factor B polypeptide 3 isoform X2 [Copidosoma floridanum]|uniref:transcription elongation factor B polypeptide 3 isoform X2 n=1 Tax=Copidosoma floridanum TaxID=29053 RepID=UPI000C6F45A6|nr:transcription elongation factor B polypeptide 3 isoform X2 [Copidosoma floridanum]
MSVNFVEHKIRHYQRSVERSLHDSARLLYCIGQLSRLPVTVLHLEVTGVGRTVNSLRKIEYGVGDAARLLVAKWKEMVSKSSNEEDDEACVPDVPESYESPDNDSEPENAATQDTCDYVKNEPEQLIALSPPGKLEINDESFDYLKNDTLASISDEKEDIKDKHKNKSSSHSSKHISKNSSNKDKKSNHKDKNGSNSEFRSKQESSRVSKESEQSTNKNKIKNESESGSSPSTSSIKDKKCLENKKRKNYSNHEDDDGNRKRLKESSSEEEEESDKNNLMIYDQESEQENENVEEVDEEDDEEKTTSFYKESRKESSRKGTSSHGDKSKSKDKHHSSSSHRSKSKESSDKSKRDEKRSSSKSHEREKDEKNGKESSKSKKSLSSSSSKDYSKNKDKDKSKSKHSKDKESSGKDRKSEKEKSIEKVSKDDKVKSGDNKERKEIKELKERKTRLKDNKEHKKPKESEEKQEQKKEKRISVEDEDGIDCNSGTSFGDALGMCPMPPKSKKRKEIPSPSPSLQKPSKIESSSSSHGSTASSSKNKSSSSSKTKPEPPHSPESLPLLSSNVTLEPLSKFKEDIDLASTLPEPSPHYRPLPQVNHMQRMLDEDQVLAQVIYAKNQRTKVFSGNKTGYTTVPTLHEMCIRVLIENIDALEVTGGVPYYIIKPILERASPEQLFMLEHHNPYLTEDTDSLWQFHCGKDFRTKKREEMETWREMYLRCLDEREAKLKALTANIKQSIDNSAPVRSTKLAYIDHMVKPPRNVLRQQARYGTANTMSKSSDLKKKLIIAAASSLGVSSCSSSIGSISSSGSSSSSVERISVSAPPPVRVRHVAPIKKVKAPLMAKALQAIKGRYKR